LIQARIARGWTQRELAARLGLRMQKIQQYEATEYAGGSVTRIRDVLSALGLRLELRGKLVDLAVVRPSASGEKPAGAIRGRVRKRQT
jgi:transcriptional regulator with XRE-family HTH domain